MIIEGNKIYGTIEECVKEVFKRVENCGGKFLEFDFCADCSEEAESMKEAYDSSSGWFGCKDISELFDNTQSYDLVFNYYGGGGIQSMDLEFDEYGYSQIEEMKLKILECFDYCGYSRILPSNYTIFEFKERKK